MNSESLVVTSDDASRHDVLTMGRPGTPSLCRHCYHERCMTRRREMLVPCASCEGRILAGEQYRVMSRVNGEVVSQVHIACERRAVVR